MCKSRNDIIYFHTINREPFKIETKLVYIIHLASDVKCGSGWNNMGHEVCYRDIYGSFADIDGIAAQRGSCKDMITY